ncbi:MAG: MFS transporter [Myxococcota bacterium]
MSRDLVRLVAAATISNFGSMLTAIALPLAAIQLLDATPAQIAAMNAAAILPGIALGLFAAHGIDRVRRRPVLVAADLARAALLVALPAAAFAGVLSMTHLIAFAFCRGFFDFAFDVAEHAYLPAVVPPSDLVRANSRLQAGDSSAEAAGFALGGWLVQLLSAPLALLVDAATYLASALLLLRIRAAEPAPAPAPARGDRIPELLAGVREIARSPTLRAVAASGMLVFAASQVTNAVYMLFVFKELGFAPGLLGMLFALGAVSSLASALAAERVPERFAGGPAMVAGLATTSLGPLLLSLAPGPTLLGVAAIAAQQIVGDGGHVLYEIHQRSLRQRITSARLLGRVSGAIRLLNSAAMLGGTALGGWLGGALGLRATLVAASAVSATAALTALLVGRGAQKR